MIRVAELPPPPAAALPTRYDAAWPLTKLPLRATPHALTVLHGGKALCLSLSSTEKCEDDPDAPPAEPPAADGVAGVAAAPRWREKYEVRLLDGASWKTLDSAALEEDEWIMGTCAAQLKDEAFPSGKIFVNVLAVGTAYQEGEDTGSRGRVCSIRPTSRRPRLRRAATPTATPTATAATPATARRRRRPTAAPTVRASGS